jgi:multidrug efflux pump
MQADKVYEQVTTALTAAKLEQYGIRWKLAGEDEEQAESMAFLSKAFAAAIFLIFAVLLAQFNSFRAVGLVLSAILMSTIGVFLGLLIMGQPFSVVMTGIGVIALAGVVVNNNIVLIDTFVTLRQEGVKKIDAILETCRERARPVVLTALTAILGVLPIAFGLNVELMQHEVTIGAPSTQWWIALSSAIVYGLAFATGLTLIVIPSLLMLVTTADHPKPWFWQRQKRRAWYAKHRPGKIKARPAK